MKNRKLLAFDLLKEKASGCPQSRVPVTVALLLSVGAQLGPCGVLGCPASSPVSSGVFVGFGVNLPPVPASPVFHVCSLRPLDMKISRLVRLL